MDGYFKTPTIAFGDGGDKSIRLPKSPKPRKLESGARQNRDGTGQLISKLSRGCMRSNGQV